MVRKLFIIAAGFFAANAAPALAITPEQAECPAKMAPVGLGKLMVDDIGASKKSGEKDPRVLKGFDQTFTACAEATKVPEGERNDYLTYVMVRIARDEVVLRFRVIGIDPDIIDRQLDLGPGKSNRNIDKMTNAELNDLTEALYASGVSKKVMVDGGATLVGYYIMLTATMHRLLA